MFLYEGSTNNSSESSYAFFKLTGAALTSAFLALCEGELVLTECADLIRPSTDSKQTQAGQGPLLLLKNDQGDLINMYKYLMGGSKDYTARLFSDVSVTRPEAQRHGQEIPLKP